MRKMKVIYIYIYKGRDLWRYIWPEIVPRLYLKLCGGPNHHKLSQAFVGEYIITKLQHIYF